MSDKVEKKLEGVERKVGIVGRILAVVTEHGNLSIGRSIMVSTFVMSMIMWWRGSDIPDGMLTFLLTMAGYIFGGKVIANVKSSVEKITEIKATVAQSVKKEDTGNPK